MPFFSKPLANLQFADLNELLQERISENLRLEFKSQPPVQLDMQKKLTGLANACGGYLIVGAEAEGKSGRITSLRGVPEQAGYRQQITGWCFDLVSPPLSIEVSDPIPVPGGDKFCYVIYVPESSSVPHFIEGRSGVWIRVGEFNKGYEPRLATESEIRQLLDRRRIVEARREAQIARSRRRFTEFADIRKEPYLELSIGPAYPMRTVTSPMELASAFRECKVDWQRREFPDYEATELSQHESMLSLQWRETPLMVEATLWGMCFYSASFAQMLDPAIQKPKAVNFYRLVGLLLLFLRHAREMLSRWLNPGSLAIEVTIAGVRGIEWMVEYRGVPLLSPISVLDDEFSFTESTTIQALSDNSDEVVCRVLRNILFAMNWSEKNDGYNEIDRMLVAGYEYNVWPVPKAFEGRRW